jgi:acetate kinase
MNILVINCGSSSLKYQLLDMRERTLLAAGLVERIGEDESRLLHRWRDPDGVLHQTERDTVLTDHRSAFHAVTRAMHESGSESGLASLGGVGHRVVHGGEAFQAPTRIGPEVVDAIRRLIPLAPLHNPANLLGIEECLELFPKVPQVAVFDTAFHQSMPAYAYRYALPRALYADHHVRRYGFHGTSHAYVAKRAARHLGRPLASLNLITLHLGNGASAAAIAAGRSVDTSMGLTPLEGLVMGTRCGDIDPALVFYLARNAGLDCEAIESLLNKESGIKGLCGANDMREVLARIEAGDADARLALDLYCYRIRKYIGAYTAALGRIDALVFTAGIGEHAAVVRNQACTGLEGLGIRLDPERNTEVDGEVAEIQGLDAAVKILVIHTNEELEIAEQTLAVLGAEQD